MQAVDDKIETIHLYVVRGEAKRSYTAFPLFCAFLCLVGMAAITLYSAEHPSYEHQRLTVPAKFLPLKVFTAAAPLIPTGVKTYPATAAHGTLTLTNGSALSEVLPAGVIFSGANGAEVQTTASVFIPAGSAVGYGMATVPAKAVVAGKGGNIAPLTVNAVYGTALYVRNLVPFSGGTNAYSIKFVTSNDRDTATSKVRSLITSKFTHVQAFLMSPCKENLLTADGKMVVTWGCRFAIYHVPSYMRVIAARLAGENFFIDVEFIPRPKGIWVR